MSVSQQELARAARGGDEVAYGKLVELHWIGLTQLARTIVGEADSEDAVQEALVRGWHKLSRLRNPEAFPSWIRKIVVRECLARASKARWASPLDVVLNRSTEWRDFESALDIETLLQGLAPRQRAVLHMTVVLGMTDREIAEEIGIRAATVRAHRRRARESLKRVADRQGKALEASL